jgi:hypothetical protein
MKAQNQIGQIGVITNQDSAALWTVIQVHEFWVTVRLCDNPEQSQNVNGDNFWVLVDSL